MKRADFGSLFLGLATTILWCQSNPVSPARPQSEVGSGISASSAERSTQARILDRYGRLPLSFEANHGQTDARVKFLTRSGGYSLFLTGDEAVLALRTAVIPAPKGASGLNESPVSLKRDPDTSDTEVNPDTNSPDAKRVLVPATERMSTGKMTGAVLRMKLCNANPAAAVMGVDELAGTSNYFIGSDPANWRTKVPTYARVKYAGIYPGIDLVYYGHQRQLEYDFIVAPGADPGRISFDIRGAKRIRQDDLGDLVLTLGEGEIRWHKPLAYQEKDGARRQIAAHYSITNTNRVAFELEKYDISRALYIDPLIYSTYLGGSSLDDGSGIAVDSDGNAYVTGTTYSTNFPTTLDALEPTCKGCGSSNSDAFVTKFNPTGSAVVYSTYLGGKKDDFGIGIAVDSDGNAYVTGQTASNNFPTKNPLQRAYGGGSYDSFVAKINPAGSALIYSTYLGGNAVDAGQGIAVDSDGNAYVTGYTTSDNFRTVNPLQSENAGGGDAFVTKINAMGSELVYSTYLGGSNLDYGAGIAVDSGGNAYVTGTTYSSEFPVENPIQSSLAGGWDAFVAKIDAAGSKLVYSTYLGGSGSGDVGGSGYGIAVDSRGNAYVAGYTISANFPTTPGALQTSYGGNWDAVVSKINPSGSALVYSTYLGGSETDTAWAIAADGDGDAYVSGSTGSRNFPTMNAFQKELRGSGDAFVSKLNPKGTELIYSTYLGGSGAEDGFGIAVDSAGHAYVTGDTSSTDFPTMNPVQPDPGGGEYDAFVTEIDVRSPTTIVLSSSPSPSKFGQPVKFTAVITSNQGAPPNGENVSFMKGASVLGTGTLKRGSASFTTSTLKAGTESIKAVYDGDTNFLGSKSKPLKQVVEEAVE
jgi:hypothetical protein